MKRLFLSDLHISDIQSPQFQTLVQLLKNESKNFDEIYLLGDLCEVWVGDDDDGPLAGALTALLADTARQARLFVMPGNRDFLYGPRFAGASGSTLIDDPRAPDADLLLAHGDAFCVDDTEYQAVRQMLRSARWQQDILARSLPERRALAQQMRAQSRATNALKAENIMDVSTAEVDRTMQQAGARVLIHGHTHRPGIHVHDWGRRYVLGAWEHCGWLVRQQDAAFSLECFPLTGRCET